jgi:Family of unknown function (DUF6065)
MRLVAHAMGPSLKMVPGSSQRAWMDASSERFAYRCIPLSFANGSGWELQLPCALTVTWNGGRANEDIQIEFPENYIGPRGFVESHFGNGSLTFHPGYLFRTEPGWGVMARGAPNHPKDGISALEGMIETDWLPFTFTMNWLFTRPGTVKFYRDEPVCFVTPVPQLLLEQITPEITPLANNKELQEEFSVWAKSRSEFNKGLAANDPETVKKGWQRHYVRGETATGEDAGETHRSKRKLKAPIFVEKPEPLVARPFSMHLEIEAPKIVPDMTGCPMHHIIGEKLIKGEV